MSLRNCVICIAGDIRQDMFAPDSWQDADIERWCKQRDMTLVWKDMNKSVTHLVISRAAFESSHTAVKYVKKDRRVKKKAKIVTYDWLDDCFDAGRAIQDVSAYDPSKPRDIDAMIAACRSPRKTAKSSSVKKLSTSARKAAPKGANPYQTVEVRQQVQIQSENPTRSTLTPGGQEKFKPIAGDKPTSSNVTQSSPSQEQVALTKSSTSTKRLTFSPGNKVQVQKDTALGKRQVKSSLAVVPSAGVNLSWEAINKPRVFRDKVDQFRYHVELAHKEKPGEKWVLQLLKAPNVADRAFLFRAYQYNTKNKIDLREDRTDPTIFQKAFELFKTSFLSKMGYPWDERMIRARDVQPGKWRYKLPAKGEPTGQVPPEFDPDHPQYVKPKDPAPVVNADPSQRVIESSISQTPYGRRPVLPNKDAMYDRLINKKASNLCARARKGKMEACYQSKARKSAAPASIKRRAESPGPERRSKVNKTGSGKFKSSEFVDDSDSDDELP